MPRALWKGPFVCPQLLEQVRTVLQATVRTPIKTQSRSSMILPQFLGLEFLVHNGKDYKSVVVTEDMIGDKLGLYSKSVLPPKHAFPPKNQRTSSKKK